MSSFTPAETLHRLVKEALDSGAAASLAEAETMFRRLVLGIRIDEMEARDPQNQIALLTAVAMAKRVFLGGVWVSGASHTPLLASLPLGASLTKAIVTLGGIIGDGPPNIPQVSIGGEPKPRSSGFHVRTAYAGWRGGILPAHSALKPNDGTSMPLAPMLAAALAINEAFLFARTGNTAFGLQPVGMSLWNPSSKIDWLTDPGSEAELRFLPSRLWFIGLGHLGQAYLWGLGLLPYARPAGLSLVLQDVDVVTPSTESTSILANAELVGQKKTRAMADWAERRGFATAIHERLFAADFDRQAEEPSVALCGLDNALGRSALDQVGFDFVVEAGLGRGQRDFRTIRLHTLPAPKPAAEIWKIEDNGEDAVKQPGYQKMLNDGDLDRCGIALLAGKAVGAPFVGGVAACLALSEILRLLHGGAVHQVIDLDLQGVEHRSAVSHSLDFSGLNPGYVDVGGQRHP